MLVFIGTYTDPILFGTGKVLYGKGEGIYAYRLNPSTGALDPVGKTTGVTNPSYLAFDGKGRYLYAVNELKTFEGRPTGTVSAFAVDPATGGLEFLNRQLTHGTDPCHVVVDDRRDHVFVANFMSGSVCVLPVRDDGRLWRIARPGVADSFVLGTIHVADPRVAGVAFTGSTAVGKLVQRAAIDNMTRVSLELGGKSPVIVLDDADPAQAAVGAAQAIFFNQGQVCTAGSRLYVQKKLFDKVVSELSAIAGAMKLGPGLDPASELGPLVSEVQRDRVCSYIDSGVGQGAKVASGGGRAGEKGYFVKPTVLVDVRQDMRVVQEEIFGPVVVALPYDDIDEAVRLANDTPYGLGASIWSNDLARVHRMIPRIKAGTVWVNCHSMLDASLPFGGFKQSGIGREMGRAALDMFTETKSVMMAV